MQFSSTRRLRRGARLCALRRPARRLDVARWRRAFVQLSWSRRPHGTRLGAPGSSLARFRPPNIADRSTQCESRTRRKSMRGVRSQFARFVAFVGAHGCAPCVQSKPQSKHDERAKQPRDIKSSCGATTAHSRAMPLTLGNAETLRSLVLVAAEAIERGKRGSSVRAVCGSPVVESQRDQRRTKIDDCTRSSTRGRAGARRAQEECRV